MNQREFLALIFTSALCALNVGISVERALHSGSQAAVSRPLKAGDMVKHRLTGNHAVVLWVGENDCAVRVKDWGNYESCVVEHMMQVEWIPE